MSYQYKIRLWTDDRAICATYVKQGSISATDFEPISFTPALLEAEPTRGFQPPDWTPSSSCSPGTTQPCC